MQERFNQYYLTEQLASKPLRSVYLAHRVSDASQKVVVKVFDAACLNLEQESESLLQKVEWAKQFKHSHIVPVLDLGVEQGQPYVINKYLSRGSLRYHLDHLSPQRLDLQDALYIVFQVGQALRYAHQHNILHSNIKPENIFFTKQGKVLLADFRLPSFINVTKLNYKSDPHTTCYMAPEQFNGIISEKSDQYALACLAYELITGLTPFSAQGFFSMWAKQSTQEPVPPSDLVPNLPEPIERAVLRGMAKNPSERYTNVSTFLRSLETISLSSTSLSISTSIRELTAPANKTLLASGTKNLNTVASDAPLVTTHLSKKTLATRLLDHPERVNHKHQSSQSTEPLDVIPTSASRATHLSKKTLATHLLDHAEHINHKHFSSQSTEPLDIISTSASLATHRIDRPEHGNHEYHSSQPLDTTPSMTMDMPPRQARIEPLPIGRLPQPGKPAPTLWLAFALSSIVFLIGTVILYAIVPLRSPASSKSIHSIPAIVQPTNLNNVTPTPSMETPVPPILPSKRTSIQNSIPIANPITHPVVHPVAQPVLASLTGSYVEQTNQTYNLTAEGTLDWIDWGLNTPQDMNHKANVSQQISNFTVIGNCTVQRASYPANSYIEWFDGTPETAAAPQQASGVYAAGINNGFSITVPANTTPKTLKLYLGANLAHGKLTASLDGKLYNDATLDMTHDPNSTQAWGVYTLVFNGNASNQVLTVTYTAIATNGSNSYVLLQAATLQ